MRDNTDKRALLSFHIYIFFFWVTRLSLQRSADDGLGLVSHANGMREGGEQYAADKGRVGGGAGNRIELH